MHCGPMVYCEPSLGGIGLGTSLILATSGSLGVVRRVKLVQHRTALAAPTNSTSLRGLGCNVRSNGKHFPYFLHFL